MSPAICRKSNEMSNFNEYLNNKEVISKSKSLLENDEPYLLEYDVAGGIPVLHIVVSTKKLRKVMKTN